MHGQQNIKFMSFYAVTKISNLLCIHILHNKKYKSRTKKLSPLIVSDKRPDPIIVFVDPSDGGTGLLRNRHIITSAPL
jgi:hypothetical protein